MKRTITVNGDKRQLEAETIAELLDCLGYEGTRGLAVALNGRVVPRGDWSELRLEGDEIVEIVGAVQGG